MAEKLAVKATKSSDSFLDVEKSTALKQKTSSDSGLLDVKRTTSTDGSQGDRKPLAIDISDVEPVAKKNVIKAEKWANEKRMYSMTSSPRGLALIIDNEKFEDENLSSRYGSSVDATNLVRMLSQLGFKVTRKNNLNRNAMEDEIKKFSESPEHDAGDMCIVTILSHGRDNDEIYSTDGLPVNTGWIFAQFNNLNCKALIGKPKLFILQACRGGETDKGITRKKTKSDDDSASDSSSEEQEENASRRLPDESDMLKVYSTVPGYTSFRSHDYGTWLIQSITDIFSENAKDTDIRDMLDMVANKLAGMENEETREVMSCTYENKGFTKKLFFNPGLVSDKK